MRSLLSRLSDLYTSIPTQYWYLIILGMVGALRFVNLGFDDMQAWDEAVYAVRSMGMLRFGEWIDQTSVSIDGLYSSFHPPLYIWLTGIAQALFGFNEFAGRFFSAAAGTATLFVLYETGRALDKPKTGFIGAMLFGLSPLVTFYSRQGQLDVTMTFFVALTMLLIAKELALHKAGVQWISAGLALGLALLSRSFVGFGVALAFLIWIVFGGVTDRRKYYAALAKITLLGLLLAAPWYVYMTIKHGGGDPLFFVAGSDLWTRIAVGFEGNVKALGPLYYVNQLILVLPLAVAWGALGLFRAIRERNSSWTFISILFLVFFVVFSAVRSKLAVYLLPTLVPFSLLAGRELVRLTEPGNRREVLITAIGITLLCVFWALRQEWRDAVREALASLVSFDIGLHHITPPLVTFLLAILIGGLLFVVWIRRIEVQRICRYLVPVLLAPAFLVMVLHIVWIDRFRHVDGAHALVSYLSEIRAANLIVAGYERNPQLTYYFNGADIGWDSEWTIRRIVPPEDSLQFRIWLTQEMQNESRDAVLIIEKDKFIRYTVIDPMRIAPENYALAFESRRYAVFVFVPFVNLIANRKGTGAALRDTRPIEKLHL